jgi:sodium transport system ATP-binding protein
MKQKVSIARTLVHDPTIVIFDEPTTGLDVAAAEIVTRVIARCKEQGKTVLFSTHHMHEVDLLCDHVVMLDDGRVCFDGTVAAMRARTGEDKLDRAFLSLMRGGA